MVKKFQAPQRELSTKLNMCTIHQDMTSRDRGGPKGKEGYIS